VIIEYLKDSEVDAALDQELRTLLSSCFRGPHNARFEHQRFFDQMPQHRWLIRDADGHLIAHLAMHDKVLGSTAGDLRVAGVAEVCVAQTHRGQGLVRRMLVAAEIWASAQEMSFAVLFGNHKIYESSGYVPVTNSIRRFKPDTGVWTLEPMPSFQVKPLGKVTWPEGDIDLRGPIF